MQVCYFCKYRFCDISINFNGAAHSYNCFYLSEESYTKTSKQSFWILNTTRTLWRNLTWFVDHLQQTEFEMMKIFEDCWWLWILSLYILWGYSLRDMPRCDYGLLRCWSLDALYKILLFTMSRYIFRRYGTPPQCLSAPWWWK